MSSSMKTRSTFIIINFVWNERLRIIYHFSHIRGANIASRKKSFEGIPALFSFLFFIQKDYYLVVANAYLAKKEPLSFILHNAQL